MSRRVSSTQRITCGGVAESRTTIARRPSRGRTLAGTGSVSARNALRYQKCRASDANRGVGVPVAITTRPARSVPPAVVTSTDRRPNVIRFAGDPSNRRAPRSAAAAARPTAARYGSIVAPSRLERPAAPAIPTSACDSARVDQRRARPAARRAFSSRSRRALFGGRRDEQRAAGLEVAFQLEPAISVREVERGAAPDLPGTPRGPQPDRLLHFDEADAGIVGDPSRRRSGAAAADPRRFDQHGLDASGGTRIRRGTPGEASADDHDVGIEMTAMAGISGNAGPGKNVDPEGLPVLRSIASAFYPQQRAAPSSARSPSDSRRRRPRPARRGDRESRARPGWWRTPGRRLAPRGDGHRRRDLAYERVSPRESRRERPHLPLKRRACTSSGRSSRRRRPDRCARISLSTR